MAKFEKRIKAHALRRQGKSIGNIANQLEVSKGTVSVWCRDIVLTKRQKELLKRNAIAAGHRGRMRGTKKNKQQRLDKIQLYENAGKKEIKALSPRDLTILAAALFWAEGAKTGSRFMFINSDPDMILCMYRYLTQVAKIESERFHITIQINKIHEKRIKKVFTFWSTLLDLPLSQFGNPYYVNVTPKKVYNNHNSYYGIARLRVNGGSSLQYKLLGYINALAVDSKKPR